jgi:protein subunit release factor A
LKKQTKSYDNSDADMTEMAKMQLDEAKEVTGIRRRNQIHVDPKDPEDAKNVMVEIRAGGGDEASILQEIYLECTLNTVRTVVGELQLI